MVSDQEPEVTGGCLVPHQFVPFLLSGKSFVGPFYAISKDGVLKKVSEGYVLDAKNPPEQLPFLPFVRPEAEDNGGGAW